MKLRLPSPPRHLQPATSALRRGFVLPSAIFLLVILASLAAFLVHVASLQQSTSVQDVLGTRAWHAAQAGIEWGLYQVLDPANTLRTSSAPWNITPPCPGTTSLPIEEFTVELQCEKFPSSPPPPPPQTASYEEAGGRMAIVVYQLTATARRPGLNVGDKGYIERQVTARVSKCLSRDAPPPANACD